MRCAPEATVTTRSVTCSSRRLVSAKWPRWFVPIWVSKPSLVRPSGTAMTPALLIRRSRSPSQSSANARTDSSAARSRRRTSTAPAIALAAASPLATSRTASTTRAPARASSRAATRPMPLLAPVTTAVRPERSGRSAAVHFAGGMRPLYVADRDRPAGSAAQGVDELALRHRRPAGHVLLLGALVELLEAEVRELLVAGLSLPAAAAARRALRLREAALERRHEVGHGRRLLLGLPGRLDRLALALALDDVLEPRPIAVLPRRRVPLRAERLDEGDRLVELRLGRLLAARVDPVRRPDLVAEAHRRQREPAVAHPDGHEVLLRAHHEAADRDLLLAAHRLDQQLVGAAGAVGGPPGGEGVRGVEVERGDVGAVRERLDVDRAGLARRDRLELLVGHDHGVAVVEVVGASDLLEPDLLVLLRAEAPGLDPRAVLRVELVEVEVAVARRAEQRHGDVDEAERERSGPQRAGHAQPLPARLASSAAIRSGVSSGGCSFGLRLGASNSISSPGTSSSAKRMVWRASTPSSGRTAARYSRPWNVNRPSPARPVPPSASWSRRYASVPASPAPR